MGAIFDKTRDRLHNIKHYMYFAVHLNQKQASNFTGQESYVRDKITACDIECFPIYRCSVLEKARAKRQHLGVHPSNHGDTPQKVATTRSAATSSDNHAASASSLTSSAHAAAHDRACAGTDDTYGIVDGGNRSGSVVTSWERGTRDRDADRITHDPGGLNTDHIKLDALERKMSRKFREQRQMMSLHHRQGESVLVHAAKLNNLAAVATPR